MHLHTHHLTSGAIKRTFCSHCSMMSLLLSSKVNRLNGLFISARLTCTMLSFDIRVDHGDLWSTSLFITAESWRNRMSCKNKLQYKQSV